MSFDDRPALALDIGKVFSRTFDVMRRNFTTFFGLSLILVGLPSALTGMLQAATVRDGGIPGLNANAGLSVLVSLVASAILQGTLVYGTVRDLNGEPPRLTEALAHGLRSFLPLIGIGLLSGLAIAFGLVLFLVPGIILACMWCVAVPALVAEHPGVFGALSRSAELTRGNRWQIFGLLVALVVGVILVGVVVGIVAGVLGAISGVFMSFNPVTVLADALIAALSGMAGATGVAVLYVELRQAQEGGAPGWLREVFS